jgi:GntR family transcriptional regulator/MocR family aminotransferase
VDQLFEVNIELPPEGSRDSSRALHAQLKAAILDGRLVPGARLPATRRSKEYFGISRNTAAEVYERLLIEGYVVTRPGSGSYVANRRLDSPMVAAPDGAPAASDPRLNAFWLRPDVTSALGFWRDDARQSTGIARVDFRPALVDPRLFPFDVFRRMIAQKMRGLEKRPASYKSPQGNQGNYFLRDGIVQHIGLTRSVVCRTDDIIVTSGAQQAFDLLARVLVTAGRTVVAIEDPGYPPMRAAFAAAGARLVPVGVDAEGLIVDDLPHDADIVCVCPSHQFPLGVTMSARRRRALIDFARTRPAIIVEDDYDGEFRYEGSSVEALRTADAADVVFYIGTFSKCMLPSLRLGYLVAPEWSRQALVAAKNCLDWHCSTPIQNAVAAFIAAGHLARHVRKMRKIYQRRRLFVQNFVNDKLRRWLEPIPSFYGMHVAAASRHGADLSAAAQSLLERGVNMHSFARYYFGLKSRDGLIFGYGAADVPALEQGLTALCEVLR